MIECKSDFRIFRLNWALTNNCNYKCGYCHSDLHGGSIKPPKYEDCLRFIDWVVNVENVSLSKFYIEFGGGEVTLLPYFSDLVKYIHHKGGSIAIVSNGSKKSSWWKDYARYFSGVSLSYHINDKKAKLIL